MSFVDDDVEMALHTSCREMVAGFSFLGALADVPFSGSRPWRRASSADVSEEQRITHLIEDLVADYHDVAPPALVDAEVRTEYARLCRESHVRDYVPMLAERTVRDHLNRRFCCGGRSAAGVATDRLADMQMGVAKE